MGRLRKANPFHGLSTNMVIQRRADLQTVNATSSSLTYTPSSGQWSLATPSGSCTTQVEASIFFNSSVSFVFVGTSVAVNIVKGPNGAPYNVTLDGDVHQYDSFASSSQCVADFQASNLAAVQHKVIVSHNGDGALAATGRSTLNFASFDYTSTGSGPGVSSGPPVGAIVGGIIAAIAVVAICGFLWWFLRRRKARTHEEKEETVHEPYQGDSTSAYVIPHQPAQSDGATPSIRHDNVMLHQPPQRSKGAEAASHSRYVRSSPWASLTSNNPSRPNVGGSSDLLDSSHSATDSLQPTSPSHSHYPPSGTDFSSDSSRVPAAMMPLLQQSSQRRYAPAPSTVGESVLIDDSDYIPPPSYSPPPSNHPRQSQSIHQAMPEKAHYEGPDESSGSSTNWLSPSSSRRPLPGGPSQNAPQTLSQSDIDVIARRVADIMRSPPSTVASGSRYSEVTSSEVENPQVQQAVRVLLAKDEQARTQPAPRSPNDPE